MSTDKQQDRERRRNTTNLFWPRIEIYAGGVYEVTYGPRRFGHVGRQSEREYLGPLAGAHARLESHLAGHRRTAGMRTADVVAATALVGPVGLVAGVSRREVHGELFITFTDGRVYSTPRIGQLFREAQSDVHRFNTLAGTGEPVTQPSTTGGDISAAIKAVAESGGELHITIEESS